MEVEEGIFICSPRWLAFKPCPSVCLGASYLLRLRFPQQESEMRGSGRTSSRVWTVKSV